MNEPEKHANGVSNYRYRWRLPHYLLACLFLVVLNVFFDLVGAFAVILSSQDLEQLFRFNLPYRFLLIGGMHPVIVHFPIAFTAWLSFIELMGIISKNQDNRRYRNTMHMVCSIMAIFAVLFGALFMMTISFSESDRELLDMHVMIQLVATAGILLSYYLFRKTLDNPKYTRSYQTTLFGSFVLLIIGSHFGGSMVHGDELLSGILDNSRNEVISEGAAPEIPVKVATTTDSSAESAEDLRDLEDKPAPKPFRRIDFYSDIYPLIGKKCFRCHGPSRQKGGLRLDSAAAIYQGGDSKQPILTPYHPDKSLMYILVGLPSFDKRRMPQKGTPLTDSQSELIYNWIMQGATWPATKE